MTVKLANNATSKLAISISSSATTIIVQPGDGAKFPVLTGGDTFPVTLLTATGQIEICRCTARSSDTFTVTRGQENTVAKAFSAGDRVELRLTNGAYEERLGEKFDKAGGSISGPVSLSGSDNILPTYSSPPATNKGDIHVVGVGPMKWNGSVYVPVIVPWICKAIGEPFPLRDDLVGVAAPPTDNAAFRYVKLTASDAYNTGVLTSESVSGSAPLVIATAVISLAGSPLNGQSINLWNTERRSPRGGNSGVLQDDAVKILPVISSAGMGNVLGGGTGGSNAGLVSNGSSFNYYTLSSLRVGTDNETRVRNQGVTYYMRIM